MIKWIRFKRKLSPRSSPAWKGYRCRRRKAHLLWRNDAGGGAQRPPSPGVSGSGAARQCVGLWAHAQYWSVPGLTGSRKKSDGGFER